MGLNIRCVQISPYQFEGKVLINVQQIIPIPETEDYQVRVRRKGEEKKTARYSDRDYTKYKFKSRRYGKGRLVVAVIKDWVESNKPPDIEELRKVFPQDIARNGTFALLSEVKDEKRYFIEESNRISFDDGTCYVISSQWKKGERHERFVGIARGLGYAIEEVD